MKETIAALLKAEAEAKNIVARAEAQAEEILRNARAESAAGEESAGKKAEAESRTMIEEGVQRAREQRVQLLLKVDQDNERLRTVPPAQAEAARKLILAALAGE